MAYNRDYSGDSGMSGAGSRLAGSPAGISLIDRDSHFNGVFRSPRDVRIEGEYEGEIHCEGTVTIAESARVSGHINAGSVAVSGTLDGQVSCGGRFEILATGQVTARVLAGTIIVREGAFYEGDMRMHAEPEGLPAREVTSPGVSGGQAAESAGRERSARGGESAAEPAPSPEETPAVNGRDAAKPQPIRAGAES